MGRRWRCSAAAKLTHMNENYISSLCRRHSIPILAGCLTATSAEDWALLMDVCDGASASEANAKAAVRALRYEFKYCSHFHPSLNFLSLSL
jgi:hypothetical protein